MIFFCTHLVMGESHTFADALTPFPHRGISYRCVRERKPSLDDTWAWSTLCFNSPAYISVNSTLKMETWESWFLTATSQCAEKLREWDAHAGSASVTLTLLLSTEARGCVSKAISIQVLPSPLPTNSNITSDPSFPPAALFLIPFWVWVSVQRTSSLVLPRG